MLLNIDRDRNIDFLGRISHERAEKCDSWRNFQKSEWIKFFLLIMKIMMKETYFQKINAKSFFVQPLQPHKGTAQPYNI